MLGLLRRASLLAVPGRWRKLLPGPRGLRSSGLLRHSSSVGKEAAGRWEGAGAWSQSASEEPFVFPEYLPEKPEEEAQAEPVRKEPGRSDGPRRPRLRKGHRVTGAADPSVPSSGVPCSGCGAELHCRDAALAGYLPSEKYLSLLGSKEEEEEEEEEEGQEGDGQEGERVVAGEATGVAGQEPKVRALEEALCQRCWLLTHHQKALRVQMPPEEYRQRVSAALLASPSQHHHGRPPLVLYMADLLDLPDSVLPDLPDLVGPSAHVFVLGNKVDLLPGDSPGYLRRLREHLRDLCAQVGLVDGSRTGGDDDRRKARRVVDVHLISARTGYGVEELIDKLQSSWKFNGDVYLVGSTNTGKSTLFNALLHSDYCKSKASDVIRRATVSPWPGTTLNLLKFPIITPTPYRIFQRKTRLQEDAKKTEDDLNEEEQKQLQKLKKYGYLIGRVGRTFKKAQRETSQFEFDAEAMSYSLNEEPLLPHKPPAEKVEFTEDEVKYSRWFYDTPGIVRDGCILNLLDEKEVKLVLPTQAIVPRTFVLKPGMTLFLGSLGRIDYLQGNECSWFSVIASNFLPVHITTLEKADAIYQKHAGQVLLKVPIGGEERMKDFPPLVSHDVILEGIGDTEAVADIKLSSAGWVAVTSHLNDKIHLRCYTPEGTKLSVRQPPLLPYIVQVKGKRLKRSPAYQTVKPPSLVQNLKARKKS